MKLDEGEDSTAGSCVRYPSKRKAEGDWPQVKEEINGKLVVNVGGTMFETSRQTLCLDRNSMLNAMITRHHPLSTMVWIDRDAERFRHVLNYLRNGTVWLDTVPSLRGLQEEAEFFGLEGLNRLCKDLVLGLQAREEEKSKQRYIQFCDAIREVFENYDFSAVNTCKDQMLTAPTSRYIRHIEPVFQTDLDF